MQSTIRRRSDRRRRWMPAVTLVLAAILLMATSADLSAQYTPRKPGVAKETASIQVTSPAAGATLEKGKRHEITWTSTEIRGGVKIELVDTKGKAIALIRQTTNSGKYSFTLMSNVADGNYTIRISTIDGKTVGESAGTVHIGKPAKVKKEVTAPKTATGLKPTTYTPRTPATQAPSGANPPQVTTTPSASATLESAATVDVSSGPAAEIVHRDLSPIQVPASALEAIKLPKMELGQIANVRPDVHRAIPSMIDVSFPVAGLAWQAGTQYNIRWASNDVNGPVKIDLIKAQRGLDGVVSHQTFPVAATTENDGLFEYLVPDNFGCHSTFFVCQVAALDGSVLDASPPYFNVYTEPIDMVCQVVNLKQRQDHDTYIFWGDTEEWIEFDVWLCNNGTQPMVTVQQVFVRLIKEPENLVVAQEEWGFSGISPQLWYSTPEPRRFNVKSIFSAPFYDDMNVNLKSGEYRVEVEIDPMNRLGEDVPLRDDNKFVRIFEIR